MMYIMHKRTQHKPTNYKQYIGIKESLVLYKNYRQQAIENVAERNFCSCFLITKTDSICYYQFGF